MRISNETSLRSGKRQKSPKDQQADEVANVNKDGRVEDQQAAYPNSPVTATK